MSQSKAVTPRQSSKLSVLVINRASTFP